MSVFQQPARVLTAAPQSAISTAPGGEGPRPRRRECAGTASRADIARELPRPGAQRRFPAAELFSAVVVAVAGDGEGGVHGAGEHRFGIRPDRAQPERRDEAAQRHLAQGIRAADAPAGVHALQRVSARPLLLPVLRPGLPDARADLRPYRAALPGRADDLEQRRDRLPDLQPAQGQPPAAGGEDAPAPAPGAADHPPAPGERARLPAAPSAPQLARLPVLGQRARPELTTARV